MASWPVEVSAADAQRFDAVGEGLVGANTAERYVRPVLIEPLPGAFDRTAAPTVLLLVAVVGGLFRCRLASRLALATGPAASIAAAWRLCNRSSSARRWARPVSSEAASERADLVRAVGDAATAFVGRGERRSGGGELADGLVELASSIGRLTVGAGCGRRSADGVAVDGPGVVDGGHGRVRDAGRATATSWSGSGSWASRPPMSTVGKVAVFQVWVGWGAGLAGVAAVGVEGGGAEQVGVVPGAALGAVDGACPGVRHVG